jgi:hypothetical protein
MLRLMRSAFFTTALAGFLGMATVTPVQATPAPVNTIYISEPNNGAKVMSFHFTGNSVSLTSSSVVTATINGHTSTGTLGSFQSTIFPDFNINHLVGSINGSGSSYSSFATLQTDVTRTSNHPNNAEMLKVELGSTNKTAPKGDRFLSEGYHASFTGGDSTAATTFVGAYGQQNQSRPTNGSTIRIFASLGSSGGMGETFPTSAQANATTVFSIGAENNITLKLHGATAIAFDDVQITHKIVPEPASWALACVGLGGLAFEIRRRRARSKA